MLETLMIMTLTTVESDTNNSQIMDASPPLTNLPTSELSLLAKLEAANKLIENDAKSLNSLATAAHSRKSSDTSQISLNSGIYPTSPH